MDKEEPPMNITYSDFNLMLSIGIDESKILNEIILNIYNKKKKHKEQKEITTISTDVKTFFLNKYKSISEEVFEKSIINLIERNILFVIKIIKKDIVDTRYALNAEQYWIARFLTTYDNYNKRYGVIHNAVREHVYMRDNYTCKECGKTIDSPHAHHILGWHKYPDKRFELDNLMTLCKECHTNIHPWMKGE